MRSRARAFWWCPRPQALKFTDFRRLPEMAHHLLQTVKIERSCTARGEACGLDVEIVPTERQRWRTTAVQNSFGAFRTVLEADLDFGAEMRRILLLQVTVELDFNEIGPAQDRRVLQIRGRERIVARGPELDRRTDNEWQAVLRRHRRGGSPQHVLIGQYTRAADCDR